MTKWTRLFVWCGAGLFVASLAVCTWWYTVRLARPHPYAGWTPLLSDALLFTVFAMHHSIFALATVKRGLARALPGELLRSIYVWTASVLLILVCALWQPVGGEMYWVTGWRGVLHAGVQLAGLWVIARSVAAIDPLELAGIPTRPGTGDTLQEAGPYRWVRHPLYLGWMLVVFGAAHMTGDRLTFAAISSLYLVVAIPWEERSLADAFGDHYSRYKQQVRWRLVPYVF